MQDQTENLENLENLINFFDDFSKEEKFMKEQLTDFEKIEMFKINFTFCHIAISRNGGLIAICKKRKFLDMSKGAVLNKNIIVMHQDGIQRYYLAINWNYNKRFIICLDFTPKEDLYGILNDGSIIKLKYYERKIKEILSPQNLREEGIVKAKFFQKGFIAFTKSKNFYYVKDFKNPIALLLCSFMNMIKLSFNLDFLIIPQDNSSSGRIELLITRKNEDNETGVIQICQKEEGQNIQFKILDENYSELLGASIILREKPQKFIVSNEVYSLKNKLGDKKIEGKNEEYEEEEEEDEDDEEIKKKKELEKENEKEKEKKKKKKEKKIKIKKYLPLQNLAMKESKMK